MTEVDGTKYNPDKQENYQVMRAELEFRQQLPRFEDIYVPGPYSLPLKTVTFSFEAVHSHWKFYHALGVLRTGPLFGTRKYKESNLQIAPLVQNGSIAFLNQHGPFDICEEYLLGYSEAIRHFFPGFDWFGHWVIHPNGYACTEEWQSEILNKFLDKGLLRVGLVVVFLACTDSWGNFGFCARAYTLLGGEIQELEVVWSLS